MFEKLHFSLDNAIGCPLGSIFEVKGGKLCRLDPKEDVDELLTAKHDNGRCNSLSIMAMFVVDKKIFFLLFEYSSHCEAPEKNLYPPHGRSSEIPRGRGVLMAKILEVKYEAKLEFPSRMGSAQQKPSAGGVWIFYGISQI